MLNYGLIYLRTSQFVLPKTVLHSIKVTVYLRFSMAYKVSWLRQVKLFHLSFVVDGVWDFNTRFGNNEMIRFDPMDEAVILKIACIWTNWDYYTASFYISVYLRSTNGQVSIHLSKAIFQWIPFFQVNSCIHHHYLYIAIENLARFPWSHIRPSGKL